ncbi:imidazole glycerol phosphate synthase, glutamine amidotransferase subunit [Psychromonas sp. CNPT3]|uniref:imidazole glycerol phosphate synthase subunit HisH n=1 Tax=Psychromonas sp. CNPT3 TaxID=314282 RepID=UPI00006E85D0|nr:imidazole glycerol phosphate synthase subunit HisH [Psychromonas sp. CNPT3]AGH81417.1 imidazole glycerol phosphate synthase, glutamine amidotransferase subunit [Psychromonas sp. CNPT3]
MIVIIDTGCANISSLKFAIERLGYAPQISNDPNILKQADKLFLPGVGSASEIMKNLKQLNLIEPIKALTQPLLGICLGMQVLMQSSEESNNAQSLVKTLGIIKGHVKKMQVAPLRSPHMGWNTLSDTTNNALFKDIPAESYFYFVHSYALPSNICGIADCHYGAPFSAAIQQDNFYGVQFHPERSASVGAQLIKNFLEL